MIEIKIPADDKYKPLAAAIGLALYNFGKGIAAEAGATTLVTNTTTTSVGEATVVEQTETLTTADIAKSINEETAVKLTSAEAALDSKSSSIQQTQTREQTNVTAEAGAGGPAQPRSMRGATASSASRRACKRRASS